MQVIQLDSPVPAPWQAFAQRWRSWRQGFDRSRWQHSWQGQAWRDGALHFPSPWGDQHLRTQLSVRRGLAFGYVLQQQQQRALLLPGWLGGGHELEALYLLREQVLLLLPCSLATRSWFLLALAELLPALVTVSPWPAVQDPQRPQRLILEGHPNFAHQLLNVLTALDSSEPGALPLHWIGQEPFGPMAQLFAEAQWQAEPAAPVLGRVFELPLSQRPDRIPTHLRERITGFCKQQLGAEAAGLLHQLQLARAAGRRVLWISLKTRGARADGLPALLKAWMLELQRRGESLPIVLLDGFSVQAGDGPETPIYSTRVHELLAEERGLANSVREALAPLELWIEEAIGFSLAESIALGEAVDGYFCHQGTVQHKLGWLQLDVPGVVHSASWRNRGGRHPWGGQGCREPLWFPVEFCHDLEQGPRAAYRFRHERLPEAACWLADHVVWRQG